MPENVSQLIASLQYPHLRWIIALGRSSGTIISQQLHSRHSQKKYASEIQCA